MSKRRAAGAFFSPPAIVDTVRERLRGTIKHDSRVLDPACGAGDLLLAAAREFPPLPSTANLIDVWGQRLYGRDLYSEFTDAARARIVILARTISGGDPSHPGPLGSALPEVRVGSGLTEKATYLAATHIVMNPPFGLVKTRDDVPWAREW